MLDTFAVDVGGTFTDIVVLDSETGAVAFGKTATIAADPSVGVTDAIEKIALDLSNASTFFHGTTLGINTILERKGATTGLITTKGFRDDIEIARMNWPMYRLHWERPPALVPRYLRKEINERIDSEGRVLQPIDSADVRRAVQALLDAGAEVIAVCLLHAYGFPAHEVQVGEIIGSEFRGIPFSLSHNVSREYREYERAVTTVVDAMIRPRLARYITTLEDAVQSGGFKGEFFVTRCDGGVMSAQEAASRSVRTLISGPASGVMGAVSLARELGIGNVLAIDMGGTSFDCALITDGSPSLSSVSRVEHMPLLMPVIELATVGAGGGSIAWLDESGTLEVGPQSAGASPGPICYGKGGTEPTFTDAALVSGLIDPEYFLGGDLVLDCESAAAGIEERIARPLAISVDDAASGIVELTEAKMAATVESITIGKGHDPRDFVLLAYGGGGPMAATALANRLGILQVVVPSSPGTFSAWGMLTLDIVHDFARTTIGPLADLEPTDLEALFSEMEENATAVLRKERVEERHQRMHRSIDMRYENQEHAISVPVGGTASAAVSAETLRQEFEKRHAAAYGYTVADPVEMVTYRVRAVGARPKPRGQTLSASSGRTVGSEDRFRVVNHRESGGALKCKVVDRASLTVDQPLEGPAIIEEPTATMLVANGQRAHVDTGGNLWIVNGSNGIGRGGER